MERCTCCYVWKEGAEMKVSELIAILKEMDQNATVEIETSNTARRSDPVHGVEAWRFFGHRSVVIRTDEATRKTWLKSDVIDMEPVLKKVPE